MRARHLRWRSLAVVVAMLGALTAGTAGVVAPAAAADDGGTTFTQVADTQIKTFNPFLSYYDGELDILGMIYPTLTSISKDGQPSPYLADSWTNSTDQLSWTFKIHQGLKWSDGQPITAKDAAWTLNLIMTNDDAATSNGSLVSNFASVTATDDTTLVIKTKEPQANMLYLSIPTSGIPIVPQHVWESKVADLKNFTNMDFPVVGYSPYTLVGNVTNQYATLKANKDFFLGAPKYDTVADQPLLLQQRRRGGSAEERRVGPDQRPDRRAVHRVAGRREHPDLPAAGQRVDRHRDQLRCQAPALGSLGAQAT